jgi:hypothetical protein
MIVAYNRLYTSISRNIDWHLIIRVNFEENHTQQKKIDYVLLHQQGLPCKVSMDTFHHNQQNYLPNFTIFSKLMSNLV